MQDTHAQEGAQEGAQDACTQDAHAQDGAQTFAKTFSQTFAKSLEVAGKTYIYFPTLAIEGAQRLPRALLVLLEGALRTAKTKDEAKQAAERILEAGLAGKSGAEIEFSPARVLFQDFTGVPVFADFASMRAACKNLGADPEKINPLIPCDLVIDHSLIAEEAGCDKALKNNMDLEFSRNVERYKFLKWAQKSFKNVRIVPPGKGICHQLNLENFASVAYTHNGEVYFDTVVGTDSHTPTINGIGVLGWGVGGIEAEAAALGQPITTLVPRVVGIHLTGALSPEVSAMDVSLTFAQELREVGVVGSFVECFGEGVASLSATQRACISNMTPEYGCTCTLFPIDEQTIDYLRLTGRSEDQLALVEAYAKAQGVWAFGEDEKCSCESTNANSRSVSGTIIDSSNRGDFYAIADSERVYSQVIEIDLSSIKRSIAGPSRPHDRMNLDEAYTRFHAVCKERALDTTKRLPIEIAGQRYEISHGALAIAALTSCTTATDSSMMLSAGLLAKNAAARGMSVKPWVKTIFAPGSHATQLLLERAGLMDGLRALGFFTCGYGCASCIGNSGSIALAMHEVANSIELASVLSGNRNFEGRISPDVAQNYLAAPVLVVAYALAGTMDIDITCEPLGKDTQGKEVYLADIWPDAHELANLLSAQVTPDLYKQGSKNLFVGNTEWESLERASSKLFSWDEASTYVRCPPYFDAMKRTPDALPEIKNVRVLALLGDFITTDHISPAGAISPDSPAACYLEEHGVAQKDFNAYGARRGNHEVMARGTFANVKLRNELVQGKAGGFTRDFLSGQITTIFDASQHYAQTNEPLVVLAGKMYGSGSSRDWAAKGPLLLGVRAVIAQSYERIHRSNLVGMGILPLQFKQGESVSSLGLTGEERFNIASIDFSSGMPYPKEVDVEAVRADGTNTCFKALVRIDTPTEGRYFEHGGILPFVLRQLID